MNLRLATTKPSAKKPSAKKDAPKKEKKVKAVYTETLGDDHALFGDGDKAQLVALPIAGVNDLSEEDAFDPKEHAPLKRADFADEATWLEWRSHTLTIRADEMHARAAELQKEAADIREHGDPAERKKAKRARKMAAQLLELKETLGIDIDELLKEAQASKAS